MRIICAASVYAGEAAFGTIGDVMVVDDHLIAPEIVSTADALIIRSKTIVDHELLQGSRVRFVGTATAGFDHIDTRYLQKQGVMWSAAPGCNANSVAEYVVTALLYLADRYGIDLSQRTLGIIGAGQVGTRVARFADVLGMHVLLNDPPLQLQTQKDCYRPLSELQKQCDIITFHVPLIGEGRFQTRHMADMRFFAGLRRGCIAVNASRGDVVETEALRSALQSGIVTHCVLDVWDDEPAVSVPMLKDADIATPHIAGYSTDGKLDGTWQIYQQCCNFFELPVCWEKPSLPEPAAPLITVDARGFSREEVLWRVVRKAYRILSDDEALRRGMQCPDGLGVHFKRLRKDYPLRREFSAFTVDVQHSDRATLCMIRDLGFNVPD